MIVIGYVKVTTDMVLGDTSWIIEITSRLDKVRYGVWGLVGEGIHMANCIVIGICYE